MSVIEFKRPWGPWMPWEPDASFLPAKVIRPSSTELWAKRHELKANRREMRVKRREPVERRHEPTIYAIGMTSYIKIGYTTCVGLRLKTLQTASPERLVLLGQRQGNRYQQQTILNKFSSYRAHGEWFFRAKEIVSWIESKMPIDGEAAGDLSPDEAFGVAQ